MQRVQMNKQWDCGLRCVWIDSFLLQFQPAPNKMFKHRLHIAQIGVKSKTLQVAEISLGQRARENRVLLEGGNIHEDWFDTRADFFTKLGKNIEAAVVHV